MGVWPRVEVPSEGMTEESYATLMEPTTREVESRKVVPRVVYWFERGGFLFLTGMPRPVLGELFIAQLLENKQKCHPEILLIYRKKSQLFK